MSLPDTFSRRKRTISGSSDPLKYDSIPAKLRNQILHVLHEAITVQTSERDEDLYKFIVDFMRKECGVLKLANEFTYMREFEACFITHGNVDDLLDACELACRIISLISQRSSSPSTSTRIANLVDEINARFLEASVGYQFQSGRLVQLSSTFEHAEIIVPALSILSDRAYAAAEHEFLDAFDALRKGDYETTLIEACKALESTIKVIGAQKGWSLDAGWPLKKLVSVVFEKELIPLYLQTEVSALRTILENGVGTVRNKSSGHGAGEKVRNVPKYLASFQLHQAAAAIILLVRAAQES